MEVQEAAICVLHEHGRVQRLRCVFAGPVDVLQADKLLDMDFEAEIDAILKVIPREGRRTQLFSATMTNKVSTVCLCSNGLPRHGASQMLGFHSVAVQDP
jgi:hypothetical protein